MGLADRHPARPRVCRGHAPQRGASARPADTGRRHCVTTFSVGTCHSRGNGMSAATRPGAPGSLKSLVLGCGSGDRGHGSLAVDHQNSEVDMRVINVADIRDVLVEVCPPGFTW
jgi:hypothetical protein